MEKISIDEYQITRSKIHLLLYVDIYAPISKHFKIFEQEKYTITTLQDQSYDVSKHFAICCSFFRIDDLIGRNLFVAFIQMFFVIYIRSALHIFWNTSLHKTVTRDSNQEGH